MFAFEERHLLVAFIFDRLNLDLSASHGYDKRWQKLVSPFFLFAEALSLPCYVKRGVGKGNEAVNGRIQKKVKRERKREREKSVSTKKLFLTFSWG
jgi:hypothetical protein